MIRDPPGNDCSSPIEPTGGSQRTLVLLDIPPEVMLQIITLLDIWDILALRKTCNSLASLTYDRSLWVSLLVDQCRQLPLYASLARGPLTLLESSELEKVVISNYRLERDWLRPRLPPTTLSPPPTGSPIEGGDGGRSILYLDVFLDRWLLCIYHERLVELWDLQLHDPQSLLSETQAPNTRCVMETIPGNGLCSSSCACIDEQGTAIIIAVTAPSGCTFLCVKLPDSQDPYAESLPQIEIMLEQPLPLAIFLVRALYAPGKLAFFSYSDSYAIVHWDSKTRWRLDVGDNDELELWNGVIAAKFITQRHILCVKAHAVELCTLPSGFQTPASLTASNPALHRGERRVRAHIISHTFSRTTYRGASISSPTILPSSDAHATKASVSFLAYDVLRGLFHYRVSLLLPSAVSPYDSAPPTLSVSLVASRYMAMPYDHSTLRSGRPPRSGLTPGGRAFVSACVLGPAGMRGVWVERRRGSVRRAVVGFRAAFQDLDKLDEGQLESAGPTGEMRREGGGDADTDRDTEGSEQNWWEDPELQVIDGSTLHEVNSYDLRNFADDITHCAFSEATTQIVLGTRNGRIQLLETTLPGAAEPVMPILDDEPSGLEA